MTNFAKDPLIEDDEGGCMLCTAGVPSAWPCNQCSLRTYVPHLPPAPRIRLDPLP